MADSTNTKSRGSNFTGAELNQLCASWMHVSQEPIVGSAQKIGAFWDRTVKHYNDNRPKDKAKRNVRSLETKWSELKRDVAKYSGCYSAVVDAQQSGENEEDTIRRAKELYVTKDLKAKDFMYVDQWIFLKDCPRFALSMDDMKKKAAQKKARKARKPKGNGRISIDDKENGSPNADGVIDTAVDDLAIGGDDGQRVSNPNREEVDQESLHSGEQRQRADESCNRLMANAQRDMAEISAKRLKLAESQDRQNLFTIRVADLDEECREYFKKFRAKELRIAMLKLQREEEEEEIALRNQPAKTPLQVPIAPQFPANNGVQDVAQSVPDAHRQNFESGYGAPLNFAGQNSNCQFAPDVSFTAHLE